MIRTRQEACAILGISALADEAKVKSAYKSLVKIYHPDSNPLSRQTMSDTKRYNEIVEAYEFMMKEFSSGMAVGGDPLYNMAKRGDNGVKFPNSSSGNKTSKDIPLTGKVYGMGAGVSATKGTSAVRPGASRDDHAAWEKKYSKYQQQKKEDFVKKQEVFKQNIALEKERQAKAEETYQKAMEAIRAVQTAEALRAWIQSNDKG